MEYQSLSMLHRCAMASKAENISRYFERAKELRGVAENLKSKSSKRLLIESAESYEKMAKLEAKKR